MKTLQLEIKKLTEEGRFSGYLSTFGNFDAGGDVVEKGAFKKTLKENDAFALLWGHSASTPGQIVGSFHGQEDDLGLRVAGKFFDDEDSQKARQKVKHLFSSGIKVGLSIGYGAIKWAFDTLGGRSIRRLKEVKLNEGSLTLWPMNERALLDTVKTTEPEPPKALGIRSRIYSPLIEALKVEQAAGKHLFREGKILRKNRKGVKFWKIHKNKRSSIP